MSPLMGLPTRGRSSCVAKRTTPPFVNTAKWSSMCGALHVHRPACEATNECAVNAATLAGQNPVNRRHAAHTVACARRLSRFAFRFNCTKTITEGHTTTTRRDAKDYTHYDREGDEGLLLQPTLLTGWGAHAGNCVARSRSYRARTQATSRSGPDSGSSARRPP